MENTGQNVSPHQPQSDAGANQLLWKLLFFSILTGYSFFYAPYGINETDGGFLTGLAWQVLNGKVLYGDIIYVRPPLPVLLRAGELLFLPDTWAVLGERWVFYLKVGVYSWLGAAVLSSGARLWMLATFGFVVSVHCYPPMAWHTVDGILFSVLGLWLLKDRNSLLKTVLAGICIFSAILCKQSFYPMAAIFLGHLLLTSNFPKVVNFKRIGFGFGTLLLCITLFFIYLYTNGLLKNYLQLTGDAASSGQALRHGVFDYFRINPGLAVASLLLLFVVLRGLIHRTNHRHPTNEQWKTAEWAWVLWLVLLVGTYACSTWVREDFTVPFAQTRLLFWAGVAFALFSWDRLKALETRDHLGFSIDRLFSLLAVSWCASISWGYNLPILFATPWVFAAMAISSRLSFRKFATFGNLKMPNAVVVLVVLLIVFRLGYEYVYRDGKRSDMNTHLGAIFPRLSGIYSTEKKGQLYLDLKILADRYPNFKTLPAFPQANFLTNTRPPLPLDWVVRRETNGDNALIVKAMEDNKPVLFIEKKYAEKIENDPELALTREWLHTGFILNETAHFWVVKTSK